MGEPMNDEEWQANWDFDRILSDYCHILVQHDLRDTSNPDEKARLEDASLEWREARSKFLKWMLEGRWSK